MKKTTCSSSNGGARTHQNMHPARPNTPSPEPKQAHKKTPKPNQNKKNPNNPKHQPLHKTPEKPNNNINKQAKPPKP